MQRLTPTLLPRLLELNELQVGRAVPDSADFHQEVIQTVLHGGDGYCLHDSLRQHSRGTAEMLRALQALVVEHQDQPHCSNDIVHVDFAHANILVEAGQISGVVDWQAAYSGDCSFDIATLLFYAYDDLELRARLWEYALSRASLELMSVYLAHMILRQVDWSLRYHDRAVAERYIHSAQQLLHEIAQRATTGSRPR
jgi:aminoglycoside phosphotransferase (APT) family kinase protein